MTYTAPRPEGHAPTSQRSRPQSGAIDPARRTRVVAWVVCGMLLLHVLAVAFVLLLAKRAAADTEARLASLPWAFPKVEVAAQAVPQPMLGTRHPPETADWLNQAKRKDTSAPWSIDRAGNVVWK